MLVLQTTVGVLVDAEQSEEGQCAGAPVPGPLECGVVDEAVDGDEVGDSDGLLGLDDLIGVEVVDALQESPESLAAWQLAVSERVGRSWRPLIRSRQWWCACACGRTR